MNPSRASGLNPSIPWNPQESIKGFFDKKPDGPGLYGEEGSKEGGAEKKQHKKGMEGLKDMYDKGIENMDFNDFMGTMEANDINPGEFAEQMRSLADVMFPEEGSA